MTKKISVFVRGTGNPELKDLEIGERTTGRDIKQKLGLPLSFSIVRKSTETFLRDDVNLHELLEEGEKLELSRKATLGL